MATELPRPTLETVVPRLVVYDDRETTSCRYCGDPIIGCGYDCQFSEWIHVSPGRAGSHKCGAVFGDRDASP